MKRLFKSKINIVITFISMLICTFVINTSAVKAAEKSSFWVEFIDVGQGDCALVQCDGHYMIIDGGPSKASSTVYTILKNKGIKTIDLMIATHPDEDHIGGLSGALNYASVDMVLSPVTSHDTKTFNSLSKYVAKQGKTFNVPKAGDSYTLGSSKIDIIGPIYSSADTNNQSIVAKVTYGANSFIFTGDAEEEEEYSIIRKYKGLNSDVLKVAHHGSNSSTSKAWLNAIKPIYAVIPVGQNSYGHPTQNTIDKLTKVGATIYRTDLHGDIIFTSDGKKLSVQTEKNASSFEINTGDGKKGSSGIATGNDVPIPAGTSFVLNTNSKKFHYPTCSSVGDMSPKNRKDVSISRDEIIAQGFVPCKRCNP